MRYDKINYWTQIVAFSPKQKLMTSSINHPWIGVRIPPPRDQFLSHNAPRSTQPASYKTLWSAKKKKQEIPWRLVKLFRLPDRPMLPVAHRGSSMRPFSDEHCIRNELWRTSGRRLVPNETVKRRINCPIDCWNRLGAYKHGRRMLRSCPSVARQEVATTDVRLVTIKTRSVEMNEPPNGITLNLLNTLEYVVQHLAQISMLK